MGEAENLGEGNEHAMAAGAAAHREVQQKQPAPIGETQTRREQIGEAALTAENRHTQVWMQAGAAGRRCGEQKFAPGNGPCHFMLRGFHPVARGRQKNGVRSSSGIKISLVFDGKGEAVLGELGGNDIFGGANDLVESEMGGVEENGVGGGFQG